MSKIQITGVFSYFSRSIRNTGRWNLSETRPSSKDDSRQPKLKNRSWGNEPARAMQHAMKKSCDKAALSSGRTQGGKLKGTNRAKTQILTDFRWFAREQPRNHPHHHFGSYSDHGLSFAGEETRTMVWVSFSLQIYTTFEFWRFKLSVVWVLVWVSSFYGDGGGSRINTRKQQKSAGTRRRPQVAIWTLRVVPFNALHFQSVQTILGAFRWVWEQVNALSLYWEALTVL